MHEARRYLNQIYRIDEEIRTLQETYDEMKAKLVGSKTIEVLPASGSQINVMENKFIKLAQLSIEINNTIDKLIDQKQEALTYINKLDNRDYRLILIKRYINGKTWEDIAIELNYELSNVYRLHRRALDELLKERLKWEKKD